MLSPFSVGPSAKPDVLVPKHPAFRFQAGSSALVALNQFPSEPSTFPALPLAPLRPTVGFPNLPGRSSLLRLLLEYRDHRRLRPQAIPLSVGSIRSSTMGMRRSSSLSLLTAERSRSKEYEAWLHEASQGRIVVVTCSSDQANFLHVRTGVQAIQLSSIRAGLSILGLQHVRPLMDLMACCCPLGLSAPGKPLTLELLLAF